MKLIIDLQRKLLKTLYAFCDSEMGRNRIFVGQSLSILVRYLDNAAVQKWALACIHELLTHKASDTVAPLSNGF